MIKRISILVCIVALFVMVFAGTAMAARSSVVDDADLLSSSEEERLANKLKTIRNEYGIDAVIVTTDDADGKSAEAYADDYYDYNGYGVGSDHTGILLLIDMDNREIRISTTGKCAGYFSQSRIDSIIDDVYDEIYDDYYLSCNAFIEGVDSVMAKESKGLVGKIFSPMVILISAGVAVGVGGIATAILVLNRGGRNIEKNADYMARANVVGRRDIFVNRTIVRTPIPKSTGKGGGGGGFHIGSSGTFHGGGGRRF